MDHDVAKLMEENQIGFEGNLSMPSLPPAADGSGQVLPCPDPAVVVAGKTIVSAKLKPISQLFTGNRQPPSFRDGPTPEYEFFFLLIERTAMDYCSTTQQIPRDAEFEELYGKLMRRPDGKDPNPLFTYLQAACKLYMSMKDVSQAEFEAVASRLRRSARTFGMGPTTRNYYENVSQYVGLRNR